MILTVGEQCQRITGVELHLVGAIGVMNFCGDEAGVSECVSST